MVCEKKFRPCATFAKMIFCRANQNFDGRWVSVSAPLRDGLAVPPCWFNFARMPTSVTSLFIRPCIAFERIVCTTNWTRYDYGDSLATNSIRLELKPLEKFRLCDQRTIFARGVMSFNEASSTMDASHCLYIVPFDERRTRIIFDPQWHRFIDYHRTGGLIFGR